MFRNKTRSDTYASFGVSKFRDAFCEWYESRQLLKFYMESLTGNNRFNKLTNHLLLIAKYYMYCCSINEDHLSINVYQAKVENNEEIEKQISTRNNSPESYYNK